MSLHLMHADLWQGSVVDALADSIGFDVVCTCSPETEAVTSLRVFLLHLLFPFADAEELPDMEVAHRVARLLAEDVALGRRVLVHCTAGKNRSGLIVALVLFHLGVAAGPALVDYVRARNPAAFTPPGDGGPFFARFLAALPREEA